MTHLSQEVEHECEAPSTPTRYGNIGSITSCAYGGNLRYLLKPHKYSLKFEPAHHVVLVRKLMSAHPGGIVSKATLRSRARAVEAAVLGREREHHHLWKPI